MQGSGVEVRKDGGEPIGSERSCLNFKQGANVTLTITDNGPTNCIDLEITAAGGGGAHAIGGSTHTSSTLAELNTKLSDATLDDHGDARPPTTHGHAESDVTNLVTDLAAKETPAGAQAKVDAHKDLTTGVHGVGASTVDSVSARDTAIGSHSGAATGVHGVGGSTVASASDLSTHAGLATGVHGAGASTLATAATLATHAALTASVHGFDVSGNAPPTSHTSAKHDSTVEATANKGASGGYCGLTGTKVAIGNLPTGATANDVCIGNDADMRSGARTPLTHSHPESDVTNLTTDLAAKVVVAGQIGGTAASPDVRGIRETSGPTLLTVGTIADGQYAKRVGATLVGGVPSAVVSNPWDGILNASYADGNPGRAIDIVNDILNTVAGPTPTGLGATVARCALFKLPAAITTARIRLFAIGTVASLYKFAIYPKAVGAARLWESGLVSTTAGAWLNITAVVTLAASTEYWWCVTTTSTGTTAAFRTKAAPVHSAFYGASVAPLGARNLGLPEWAQFAVTAGTFPATLPTIVAAAYGAGATGTVPIAFFDSVS